MQRRGLMTPFEAGVRAGYVKSFLLKKASAASHSSILTSAYKHTLAVAGNRRNDRSRQEVPQHGA